LRASVSPVGSVGGGTYIMQLTLIKDADIEGGRLFGLSAVEPKFVAGRQRLRIDSLPHDVDLQK
jgi:hypothetical protein